MVDEGSEARESVRAAGDDSPAPAPELGPLKGSGAGPKSCLGSVVALLGVALGGLYVINPGAGMIELIPDIVPLFGNLDEAAASAMLIFGLQYLFGRRP